MSPSGLRPAVLKRPTLPAVLVISICGALALASFTMSLGDTEPPDGIIRIEGTVQAVNLSGTSVCIEEKGTRDGRATCHGVQFAEDRQLSEVSRSLLRKGASVEAFTIWVPDESGGAYRAVIAMIPAE